MKNKSIFNLLYFVATAYFVHIANTKRTQSKKLPKVKYNIIMGILH